MTSAIAAVSFDANKFISKQSNTPSANEAGNSFNQILAKQVEAKRANRSEQAGQRNGDKVATGKQSDKPNVVTKTENATEVAGSTKDKDETVEETPSNSPSPIIALVEGINKPLRANDIGNAEEIDASSLVNTDETASTANAQLAGTLAINANSLRELAAKDGGVDSGNRSSSPSASPDVAALGVNELAKANAINESVSKSQASTTSTELNEAVNGSFLSALEKANQNSVSTARSKLEADAKTDAHNEALGSATELKEKGLLNNVQLNLGSLRDSKDVAQAANSVANNEITPSNFQTIAQQVVAHANQEQIQQSEHLAPNVGTRAWDQALGQKVIWLVAGGQQSAELTLNPPDLGPLQVVLKVSDDRLTVDFSANQAEVREALESALPKLRQILNDAGIQLFGFSVNSQASQQQNQFTQDQSPHSLRRAANSETDTSVSSASNVTQPKFITKVGLVDTFA
jgi:flagellar hook-length control protein FliK